MLLFMRNTDPTRHQRQLGRSLHVLMVEEVYMYQQ
jgi:hypothetical protein